MKVTITEAMISETVAASRKTLTRAQAKAVLEAQAEHDAKLAQEAGDTGKPDPVAPTPGIPSGKDAKTKTGK